MTAIDVGTGLPELPDGYRWVVDHPNERGYGFYMPPPDRNRLRVYVQREIRGEHQERHLVFWKRTITTIQFERVDIPAVVAEGTAPIAVLNAARRYMKQWDKRRATAALVGTYPPKKLKVS